MAGQNDAALAGALEAMAQVVGNLQGAGDAGTRSLATFQRENPPAFEGKYDPDGAMDWLREMERIFRVMDCTDEQKVRYGTHMLKKEADDWWLATRQRLMAANEGITWVVFSRDFLRKYYPEDVRGKKEMEFLKLEQGNMSVTEYAAKFTELSKFYPHYDGAGGEFSKCIKFENGLRGDIKKAIGYQQIRVFSLLVDSCRIFEEDSNAHSRVMREKQKNVPSRGKPYKVPAGRGNQEGAAGKRHSGGDAAGSVVCYKCGKAGHKHPDCPGEVKRCFKCGKEDHMANNCDRKDALCFNCGEGGHISAQCPKPKKERSTGKVFVLAGES